jgi:hypothetical protein
MYVFNKGVPFGFYSEFAELVRNSTLEGRPGTIALLTDPATQVQQAIFTPGESGAQPRPVGRGTTARGLFLQVLATIEPRAVPASVPRGMEHPGPGRWWWLCFCDPAKPGGEQFLGVAIVQGRAPCGKRSKTQASAASTRAARSRRWPARASCRARPGATAC